MFGVHHPPRKISIKGARLVPTAALVDPDFLVTVPPRVGAAAATDALTHALEAYLRPASTPVSRALGLRAATMILRSGRIAPRWEKDAADDDMRLALPADRDGYLRRKASDFRAANQRINRLWSAST